MSKVKMIALWIVTVLCAAMFLFAGSFKFIYPDDARKQFEDLGYADWFRVLIGALEITGAVLLLLPRLAWIGSGMLGVIMIGAVVSVVRVGVYEHALVPAVLFVALVWITYMRSPSFGRQAVR
jgi:uncharacterized membrane protein YphA (DoxX/SURF4 family)